MGSPALFSGTFVKLLKDKLNLFDKAYILTGTQDPRVSATDAPKGSILMRQTASGDGQVFFKLDNGSSTNWKLFTADKGAANEILENLKDELTGSVYSLMTTNIGGYDGATKWAALTGAAYDPAVNAIRFTANAQVAASINMLDTTEFSGQDLSSVDLSLFWSRDAAIPTGFTYEVSRDGGLNYFPMTMNRVGSTNVVYGTLRFDTSTTTEPTPQTFYNDTTANVTGTSALSISQRFTLTSATKMKDVTVKLSRGSGTPIGNIKYDIIRDSTLVPNSPSLVASDIVATSGYVSIQGLALTTTLTDKTFSLNDAVLPAGTYHLVQSFDSVYAANLALDANDVCQYGVHGAGSTTPFALILLTGTWVNGGSLNMTATIRGRTVDLRVRVTSAGSPTYPCLLDGYGVFYGILSEGVQQSIKANQRFIFNSTVDNTNVFTITSFNPDPDLLECFYVEAGQVFKVPAFTLSGNVATFPANSFNNGGISAAVTLIFSQQDGGSYDNSDSNARIIAENHLGSASGIDDRSVAGRGPRLRRSDGVLVEISIDASNNIVISTVP